MNGHPNHTAYLQHELDQALRTIMRRDEKIICLQAEIMKLKNELFVFRAMKNAKEKPQGHLTILPRGIA
jgi:hypothetical protein